MAGTAPQTVVGDRGFSVKKCFEYAMRKGIAPVFPMRRYKNQQDRPDTLTHDRHGVMRCKHCGGEMKQKRFAVENGTPYLWFKCIAPFNAACEGEQRIRCETDWRSLIPISRLEPLYHELKASHRQYEGVHDYWRDRYRVAGDTLAMRPKVVSLNWHRLRAHVACLIDWLRIAAKAGWLGSARSVKRLKKGVRGKMEAGVEAAAKPRGPAWPRRPGHALRADGGSSRTRRGTAAVGAPRRPARTLAPRSFPEFVAAPGIAPGRLRG